MALWRTFVRDETGATAAEYALLLVCVGVGLAVSAVVLNAALTASIHNSGSEIAAATTGSSSGGSGSSSSGGSTGSGGQSAPGASGSAPGQTGNTPGLGGGNPGQTGTTPGQSGNAPGQKNKP